ncbi:tetratricopeptide repeat protein [Micromonospora sp. NPDC006766]|uniref:tetratricopeptide repeat protein n=1 Tax=Micromonospora sp. NPDC006766 TaxID=3154778 RepID=UPI0033D9A786
MPRWLIRALSGLCGLVVGASAAWAGVTEDKPIAAVLAGAVAAMVGAFAPTAYDRLSASRRRVDFGAVATVPPPSVAWLLQPGEQVVPFRGRDTERRQLTAWCADRGGSPVRLVFAPGGYGKTRLALKLMDELTGQGWQCVPVRPGHEREAAEKATADGAPGRLLLVVDYADARAPDGLAQLLAAATRRRTDRVRVLLLARTAGSWWTSLSATAGDHAALLDAMTGDRRNLMPLAVQIDARTPGEVVAHAAEVFARRLKRRPVPNLAGRTYPEGSPVLRLHAAALVAVLGGPADDYGRGDAIAEVLGHERRYWRDSAKRQQVHLPDDVVEADALLARVVGVAALFGADDEQGVAGLVQRAVPAKPDRSVRWVRWFYGLYPADGNGAAGRLGTLQPDLLAEHLAVQALAGYTAPERQALFRRLTIEQAVQALTVLGRAASDQVAAGHAEVDEFISEALAADVPTMAEAVVRVAVQFPGRYAARMATLLTEQPPKDLQWLRDLAERVPYPSLELNRLALALTTAITSTDASDATAHRALWRLRHAVQLAEAGRTIEALTTSNEAVNLYRELVQLNRDAHLPRLAGSLNNHAIRLAEAGQQTEALTTSNEAVKLRRELVDLNRDAHLPDLAGSLNNYASDLAEAGRRTEALTTSNEAVKLHRELVDLNRDAHLPNLAHSLNNYASALAEAGRRTEALTTSNEAVKLRRELVDLNRDAHLPNLAQSLHNHAVWLVEAGRRTEALTTSNEAVKLYRELVQLNRDAHLPDLAGSLNIHAIRLADAGRRTEALTTTNEAVKLHRELVNLNRDAYLPSLARSLWNFGWMTVLLGAREEAPQAIEATAEAVRLFGELAATEPDVFVPLRDAAAKTLKQLTDNEQGPSASR